MQLDKTTTFRIRLANTGEGRLFQAIMLEHGFNWSSFADTSILHTHVDTRRIKPVLGPFIFVADMQMSFSNDIQYFNEHQYTEINYQDFISEFNTIKNFK